MCWSKSRPPGRPCPGMTTSLPGSVFESAQRRWAIQPDRHRPRSPQTCLTTHERHNHRIARSLTGRIQPDCRSNAQHQDRRALLDRSALRPRSMRVLLENAWESRSPLPRLAGVSTVMRTLPPQPPEGSTPTDAVVMKVRGDCTRYGKSNLLFNLREKCRCVFRTHAVSIKSNSSPSRTMRPLDG